MNAYCGNNQNYYFSKKMEKERAERKEAIKQKENEQKVTITSDSLKFQDKWVDILNNTKWTLPY